MCLVLAALSVSDKTRNPKCLKPGIFPDKRQDRVAICQKDDCRPPAASSLIKRMIDSLSA